MKRTRTEPLPFDYLVSMSVLQAYAVVRFLLQYAVPVGCFGYCYGRIFQTIRRQSKVVSAPAGGSHDVAMTTVSRAQNTGQVQQQATGTTPGANLSRTEINVLQTMIGVIICFIACFTVNNVVNVLRLFGVSTGLSTTFCQNIP